MSNGVVGLRVRVNATLVDGALHQYAEEMSCRGNERGGQAPNRPRGPSRRGLLPARGQETSHTRHLQVVTGGLQRRDCRRGLEQHLKGQSPRGFSINRHSGDYCSRSSIRKPMPAGSAAHRSTAAAPHDPPPPHSFEVDRGHHHHLWRLCSQMLVPPQSLH